jgi:hypothetical protein
VEEARERGVQHVSMYNSLIALCGKAQVFFLAVKLVVKLVVKPVVKPEARARVQHTHHPLRQSTGIRRRVAGV